MILVFIKLHRQLGIRRDLEDIRTRKASLSSLLPTLCTGLSIVPHWVLATLAILIVFHFDSFSGRICVEKLLDLTLIIHISKKLSKGNQSWIFIGRTDAEAETSILWPPDAKNWLIGKDPDAGKDWRQEKKGTTEDKIVGWHHRLYGHEFEYALGVDDGQGSLVCCSSWGRKESDMTEWLN